MKAINVSLANFKALTAFARDQGRVMSSATVRGLPGNRVELDVDDEVFEALAKLDPDPDKAIEKAFTNPERAALNEKVAAHLPLQFERGPEYIEHARVLKRTLEPHEGYPRENSGAWVLRDKEGVGLVVVNFQGKAPRGKTWNAPDPEGQAIAEYIKKATNGYSALVEFAQLAAASLPNSKASFALRDRAVALLRELGEKVP